MGDSHSIFCRRSYSQYYLTKTHKEYPGLTHNTITSCKSANPNQHGDYVLIVLTKNARNESQEPYKIDMKELEDSLEGL